MSFLNKLLDKKPRRGAEPAGDVALAGGGALAFEAERKPRREPKAVTERDIGQHYFKEAQGFEKSKRETERTVYRLAIRFAVGALVVAAIAIIGLILLAVLKRPNPPPVLRVDNATGTVTVLPTTASGHVTWTEKEDRADLRRYVEQRESYDWETINDMHNAVMVMSGAHEKDLYDTWLRGPGSPLNILKDKTRVVAKVGVITYVGDTAQVFFSKTVIPLDQGTPRTTEYWVATIAYTHDDVPETTGQQDVDPTGFRVLSYRVDRDWSRAPAEVQPSIQMQAKAAVEASK